MAIVEFEQKEFLPIVRCGSYYADNWISRYLRVDFELPSGRPFLEFRVFAPAQIAGASFLVRHGLVKLYDSPPMEPKSVQEHRFELPVLHEAGTVSISIRSSAGWTPGGSDKRVLGLVLPVLRCVVRP